MDDEGSLYIAIDQKERLIIGYRDAGKGSD
jgi:hypothetical protein